MSGAIHVKPNSHLKLSEIDPSSSGGMSHEDAAERISKLGPEMEELQELMFAAGMNSLLIVLQGRDTSGKDGTIRHLLQFVNVQTCKVQSFKVPTELERSHDFLWRVHQAAPANGGVTIFNRSHYEDVLVVRVHKLIHEKTWKARYEHIKAFENLLTASNTIVLKFYLHISKAEQEQRLLDREHDDLKSWKLSVGDWQERELWDHYTEAYEDALSHCSTENAPWYVVPANHKWARDVFVTERIVEALRPYKQTWAEHLAEIGRTAKAELAKYRTNKTGLTGG